MNIKDCFIILFVSIVLFSCNSSNKKADAYGNFEAVETIISAEVTGKLLELGLSEGDNLEVGQTVGLIDTVQLYFQKKQL
ncbi:MAG: HlyD family secretion protein, partial [Bacteroidales bacterium]|nr:HlyD family secretion protein [Bacteroidales bacterium]